MTEQKTNSSQRIDAVAFDMDGLMFNTEDVYWKAADALLSRRGFRYTDELCARMMGRPPKVFFETLIHEFSLPEPWRVLENESEELFLEFLQDGYHAMPGLYDLLDRMESRGLPKSVCTSSSRRILDAVVGGANLLSRFDFFLTAEEVTHGKPNPEIYRSAAVRFGVNPAHMLVLEDSEAGCRAGKDAGAVCYAIRAEHNRNTDLSVADRILKSLAEVEF